MGIPIDKVIEQLNLTSQVADPVQKREWLKALAENLVREVQEHTQKTNLSKNLGEKPESKQHNTEISALALLDYNFSETLPIITHDGAVLLEVGERCILSGYAKEGKTQYATMLAVGLANGVSVMGFDLPKKKVLYLNGELHEKQFQKRLRQIAHGLGVKLNGDLIVKTVKNYLLSEENSIEDLLRSIKENKAEVIVIDTLSSVTSADDSDQPAMKQFCMSIDNVIDATNVTVIVVHHQAKAGREKRPAIQTMRGSSYLAGWTDLNLTLLQQPNGKLPYIEVDVTGRGDPCPNLYFRRDNESRLYTSISKEEVDALMPFVSVTGVSEGKVLAIVQHNPHITRTGFSQQFKGEQRKQAYAILDVLVREGRIVEEKIDSKTRTYLFQVPSANTHEQRENAWNLEHPSNGLSGRI